MATIDEMLGADLMQDLAPFMPGAPAGTGSGVGGALSGLFDTLTGSDLIQTGLSAAALQDQMSRLSDIGTGLATGARELGEEAQAGTAFRPFTVSTGFGGVARLLLQADMLLLYLQLWLHNNKHYKGLPVACLVVWVAHLLLLLPQA